MLNRNSISEICGKVLGKESPLNRNEEDSCRDLWEIAVSLIADSYLLSSSHLLVPIDTLMSLFTYLPMLRIPLFQFPLFCFYSEPSLNHEWFDIYRQPITLPPPSLSPRYQMVASVLSTNFLQFSSSLYSSSLFWFNKERRCSRYLKFLLSQLSFLPFTVTNLLYRNNTESLIFSDEKRRKILRAKR